MKIFGLCLVKNEEDIVGETLPKALRWCDRIFVFDTGSEDRTWETIIELSKKHPEIVPYKKEVRVFHDGLRSEIFNHFRANSLEGDWWCRLDADEIYIDDPKVFLAKVPPRNHVVFSASYQFYFTEADLRTWETNSEKWHTESVEEKLRYCSCNHSEARFFRYRNRLQWKHGAWPLHMGVVHADRIRLKHYQYRSPPQMEKRISTRRAASEQGWKLFDSYDGVRHWREKVASADQLVFFNPLRPEPVPRELLRRHQENRIHRLLKQLLHGAGVWP